MFLLVGLGNPGRNYEKTRHNVGFRWADEIAAEYGIGFSGTARHSVFGKISINAQPVIIAKPVTYMNRSGLAVRELVESFEIDTNSLLVASDDVHLEPGRIKIRPGGSAGGQKGLKSIIGALGTEEFPRLRIGVGRPPEGMPMEDYVLNGFTQNEEEVIEESIYRARCAAECWLKDGMEEAMGRFNRWNVAE
jgi:peptidyl-tRNA hydrolase, PTH1 family